MTRALRPLRLLLVEDDENDALLVLRELRRGGFDVTHERVETAAAMREALARGEHDLVLSDFSMPEFSALGAIATLAESGRSIPLIVVSGTIGEETAVEVLRAGARDFVVKGRLARLVPAIQRELHEFAARTVEAEKLRQAEERLIQAQKMEAIGRLAGGVAHDFNNLLSVVLSYSELLSMGLPEGDPMRADLAEILHAAARATDLTRQLLAFSRKQVLQPRPVDVRAIVRGMVKMLGRVLREDVELVVLAAEEPTTTTVDPGQLEQVVMNLAVNARDAMPDGGKLVIALANVQLDAAAASPLDLPPGCYVHLAVRDSGVGMDRQTQERIFEPFFTTKEIGKGTGLGLATVFGIVQQSGGRITVDSAPGEGTTFGVYFPATDQAATVAPPPRPRGAVLPRGTETVLVVEDDPAVLSLIRNVLQDSGYRALEASTAGDAVLLCETHLPPIHLLIADVVMPRMNGPQLAARLTAIRPGMKVLYMSGYSDDAILPPETALLPKPLTPGAILCKVREVLDG